MRHLSLMDNGRPPPVNLCRQRLRKTVDKLRLRHSPAEPWHRWRHTSSGHASRLPAPRAAEERQIQKQASARLEELFNSRPVDEFEVRNAAPHERMAD